MRSGNGTVYIGDKELPIHTGDVLVFNPHVPHYESGKELSFYFFGVNNVKLENMQKNYLLAENVCPVLHTGNEAEIFETCFSQLISEAERKLYYYDEISDSLVKIILSHVLRILAYGNDGYFKTNESYRQAKEYIDQNYANIKSIDDVCSSMYISRFYLTHLFKEYSGMSPLKYILIKRMEQAKELLTTTDLPISEIALLAGYAEVNSFIKTFKNIESVTPAAYRSAQKQNSSQADIKHSQNNNPWKFYKRVYKSSRIYPLFFIATYYNTQRLYQALILNLLMILNFWTAYHKSLSLVNQKADEIVISDDFVRFYLSKKHW